MNIINRQVKNNNKIAFDQFHKIFFILFLLKLDSYNIDMLFKLK